ncbi:MAG: bifunctional hydroxymethylpyrimidine kinase/phosphomethylpyrimidine kinase [Methylobacteriaceae bacterium]|nr:bifunctional hydroxymethylpyrimidine kinase/phosphomethylpyrimidine kinase [Methylobacteriaceae bacterium]
MIPNVLSIAGSDPSGGAGIQADLKTFAALGCYGMAALTALTAQNTRGVSAVHVPPAAFLGDQIDAIFADIEVGAVKIGMLATGEIVALVAERIRRYRPPFVVLDPVLVAASGDSLGAPGVVEAMRATLIPAVTLITPNLPEAARLAEEPLAKTLDDMRRTAEKLHRLGPKAVLVKGGHLQGSTSDDVLFDGNTHRVFSGRRIDTPNTHGTGCTLSSAIAANLAKGLDPVAAIEAAKAYLTTALAESAALQVGHGHGPVHHFHALWQ